MPDDIIVCHLVGIRSLDDNVLAQHAHSLSIRLIKVSLFIIFSGKYLRRQCKMTGKSRDDMGKMSEKKMAASHWSFSCMILKSQLGSKENQTHGSSARWSLKPYIWKKTWIPDCFSPLLTELFGVPWGKHQVFKNILVKLPWFISNKTDLNILSCVHVQGDLKEAVL